MGHLTRWLKSENNESRPIEQIPQNELEVYLSEFFNSIRQKNGQEYEPGTLKAKENSINRYLKSKRSNLRVSNMDLAADAIKNKQKDLKNKGYGNRPFAADSLTPQEEELLYERALGFDTPEKLINLMWFTFEKFLLQRGNEGVKKCCWGDIELKQNSEGNEILEFSERATKTRTGTNLSNTRPYNPKMHSMPAFPEKCPVRIYKAYRDRRPADTLHAEKPFFLAICHNRRQDNPVWYKDQPMGIKKMQSMLKDMCKTAGIEGRKTNHSMRKTGITRLLGANVHPVMVQQLSGHKNLDSLKKYFVASDEMQENMSDILGTNAMQYRNPLAIAVGRNKSAPNTTLRAIENTAFPVPQSLSAPMNPMNHVQVPHSMSVPQNVPQNISAPENVSAIPVPQNISAPQNVNPIPIQVPYSMSVPQNVNGVQVPQNMSAPQNVNPIQVPQSMMTSNNPTNAIALPGTSQMSENAPRMPYGLLQNANISGNPNITINYNCLSQSQMQPMMGMSMEPRRAFKRIRNMIESDEDSD